MKLKNVCLRHSGRSMFQQEKQQNFAGLPFPAMAPAMASASWRQTKGTVCSGSQLFKASRGKCLAFLKAATTGRLSETRFKNWHFQGMEVNVCTESA